MRAGPSRASPDRGRRPVLTSGRAYFGVGQRIRMREAWPLYATGEPSTKLKPVDTAPRPLTLSSTLESIMMGRFRH